MTLNNKADKPIALVSGSNWKLEHFFFVEGGKPENPEKTLEAGTRTNKKLNPHVTPGSGIESGQSGEKRALSPLCHPCTPKLQ